MSIDRVIDRVLAAHKHGKTMDEYQDIVREERMRNLVEANEREAQMQEQIRKLNEKLEQRGEKTGPERQRTVTVEPPPAKRRIQIKR